MRPLTRAYWHLTEGNMPWGQEVNKAVLDLINDKLGYAPASAISEPIANLPDPQQPHKIALCLGHARPVDEGTVGAGGISEEQYNTMLIGMVATKLTLRGIPCVIFDFYPGESYATCMQWLAMQLIRQRCTAAIEFHFNAFDGKASGHEVLHWEKSKRGITLARSINASLTSAFPSCVDRGIKGKNHADRGALFLSLTHCPAAIIEPFFGDNLEEWTFFSRPENIDLLAESYATGIARWLESTEVPA